MPRNSPVPGSRSREWLQNARSKDFEFVNPTRFMNLIPGRQPETSKDRFVEKKKMLGMESELAKKWE